MKAVVRRLAYGALGLAFTRVLAAASLGRRSAAFDAAPSPIGGPPSDLANFALLGALAAAAVAAGGLGGSEPAAPRSRRERRALRALALAGSALSLASATSDPSAPSTVGIAANLLLLPASLALVRAAGRGEGPLRASSRVAAGTVGLHLATGLAFRSLDMPATLRAAHAGLGALAWLSMVVAATLALRAPVAAAAPATAVAAEEIAEVAEIEQVGELPQIDATEIEEPVRYAAALTVVPVASSGMEIETDEAIEPAVVGEAPVPPVPPAAPRRPPTLAVLLARGADF